MQPARGNSEVKETEPPASTKRPIEKSTRQQVDSSKASTDKIVDIQMENTTSFIPFTKAKEGWTCCR